MQTPQPLADPRIFVTRELHSEVRAMLHEATLTELQTFTTDALEPHHLEEAERWDGMS